MSRRIKVRPRATSVGLMVTHVNMRGNSPTILCTNWRRRKRRETRRRSKRRVKRRSRKKKRRTNKRRWKRRRGRRMKRGGVGEEGV